MTAPPPGGRRVACAWLPAFPLQILLRDEPSWRERPAAVVEADHPRARILEANEAARRGGVLPGLRYGAALALERELRGGVVDAGRVQAAADEVAGILRHYSPHLERDPARPGALWLDASGLGTLHPSLDRWAALARDALARRGFEASMAVGWRRFATWALATTAAGIAVPGSPEEELARAREVPLAALDLAPELRDALARLGVRRVGEVRSLPERGLRERFGAEAAWLRRVAEGEDVPPRPAVAEVRPVRARRQLPAPVADTTRLVFVVKRLLPRLLRRLAARGEVLAALELRLALDHAPPRLAVVRPAQPTSDEAQVLELVRLKLDALALPAGVEEVTATAVGERAAWEQPSLFTAGQRRDLDAASRALARVRAALGEGAVVCAELRDAHLPEARFRWVPVARVAAARPDPSAPAVLVRRLLGRPRTLEPPARRARGDGWLPLDAEGGAVVRSFGPFVVSGGWWGREARRDYHFAETERGELLWIWHDAVRRRWRQQGMVD